MDATIYISAFLTLWCLPISYLRAYVQTIILREEYFIKIIFDWLCQQIIY